MSAIDEILKQIPISQLAGQVGASKKDTKAAATTAIKSLLGGMSANVADGGESALAGALQNHAARVSAGKAPTVDTVDPNEGAKIVKHVLGTDPETAAAAVAAHTGTDASLLQKLMPLLAPIVMSYLASKMFGGSAGGGAVGAGLGGLLGSIFGGGGSKPATDWQTGGQPAAAQPSSGGGLGDLLGGLLGGGVGSGNSASSSGGLGGILNSIF